MPKAAPGPHGVLCDTSFFIRLAKPDDDLHRSANAYLRFLVENRHLLFVSTIALAEYAVRDSIDSLPLSYFRIIPFNIDHAMRAGEFARAVFEARKLLPLQTEQRAIIPNDTKLFAQADVVDQVTHYLTADRECAKIHTLLKSTVTPRFQLVHLSTPCHQAFGHLDLHD